MYTPLNYQQLNMGAGKNSPSPVKAYNNVTFAYWERSLFQRACNVLDFTLPDDWRGNIKDFFLYCLYRNGYVVISKDAKHGQYFQPCTVSGIDFYYQPTRAIIANPDLHVELKLHKDGELLKLTPDYMGVWDIITYYAEKLSSLDNAINMSIINNKFAFILGAKTKTAAEAIKKVLDLINSGEPAVVVDQKLCDNPNTKESPFQFLERENLKQSYLTTDQLQDFRTILNNFDAEIGIPTNQNQKRERMITAEANNETFDGAARSEIWYKTLTASIDAVKALYPDIKLDVKLRYDLNTLLEGGVDNGSREANVDRL